MIKRVLVKIIIMDFNKSNNKPKINKQLKIMILEYMIKLVEFKCIIIIKIKINFKINNNNLDKIKIKIMFEEDFLEKMKTLMKINKKKLEDKNGFKN
jgi:hypothetical protein